VIVQGLAIGGEGDVQALGLAVAAGESKSDVRPAFPSFQQAWMQRFSYAACSASPTAW